MEVLDHKPAFRSLQGAPTGALCLRIVGTARDGQIVRLTSPKCTIGSANGCSLRLRAAGVRPVHCLVLRGSRGTIARAWAPNTRLNGHNFTDTSLADGDRLKIGPIELEVVADDGNAPSDSQSPGGLQATSATTLSSRADQTQILRGRIRNLIGTVRGLRQEVNRLSPLVERLRPLVAALASELSQTEALPTPSEPNLDSCAADPNHFEQTTN